jgi:hypothetical protein
MTHKIFILAIMSTAVLARGSNALPDREAEAGSALYEFASQYASITSVSMTATANVQREPPSQKVGTIQIEFWSSGDTCSRR